MVHYVKKNFLKYSFLALGAFGLVACGDSDNPSSNEELYSSSDFFEPGSFSSSAVIPESSVAGISSANLPQDSASSSSASLPNLSSAVDELSSAAMPVSSEEQPQSSAASPESSSAVMQQSSSEAMSSAASSSSEVAPVSSAEVISYAHLAGADISKFQEYESRGTKFIDTDGKEKDIFTLLKGHGFNAIRLKTFVSPKTQYGYAANGCGQEAEAFGDKEHVIAYGKRVKAAGLYFLLDIHYSDNWADPGKQIIPERWRNVPNSDVMADSVYAYTFDLVNELKKAGARPDMVQIGNEITNGLLRDLPTSNTDCWGNGVKTANAAVSGIMSNAQGKGNTGKYLKAGVAAVKAVDKDIKTSFHIENIEKTNTVDWWMTEIFKTQKISADAMGFSAYTAYDDGTPDTWKTFFMNLSRTYTNLEFFIAEYNGGEKDNYYSYNGSRAKTHQIMGEVPRGLGEFFWEPGESGEWGPGLFDWEGNKLKANPRAFEEYK